jgi:hypothetical protein
MVEIHHYHRLDDTHKTTMDAYRYFTSHAMHGPLFGKGMAESNQLFQTKYMILSIIFFKLAITKLS